MVDAKALLHEQLREQRDAVVRTLDGLSEYDTRRPLTATGTSLLGLVKHLATWEARYLGEVFDRPFPGALPRWDDPAARGADLWATEDESRADVLGRYRAVWAHGDATVEALPLDAPGFVPWWPRPHVTLADVLAHRVVETSRHAGHADILREQLDGTTSSAGVREPGFWEARWERIERAAAHFR
ncbi:DinB family protein [Actinokineospora bangkokensis]|uniref:Type I restriction endonuclease subunit M n=1 Tax=Actinokineospora bangkokensis TaxID=1193682 RepID=A0A1Q9LNL9_9PSEU|nr:DinB family protein [Actinokineospora bangkokensis]OLR93620.1 type I restriction endonuclease subunit M [Actinokineospora bangkokensis]